MLRQVGDLFELNVKLRCQKVNKCTCLSISISLHGPLVKGKNKTFVEGIQDLLWRRSVHIGSS